VKPPDSLDHVYWIGGGTGSGKSTISRRLADRYGLDLYATDDVMADHARRLSREAAPYLADFIAMDMDQRWLNRPVGTMLETFHWFRGEGFELIVSDLRGRPRDRGVVAEGFRLLPHLVRPLLADPAQAVWLLPTQQFQRAAFEQRGTLWKVAGQTSDPPRALNNLLERDWLFTERLRDDAQRLGLPVIEVATMTEDALADQVARHFRL
jgi:2-phosphoglycerate kinase